MLVDVKVKDGKSVVHEATVNTAAVPQLVTRAISKQHTLTVSPHKK